MNHYVVLSIPMEIIEYENLRGHMSCFRHKSMLLTVVLYVLIIQLNIIVQCFLR